MKLKKGIVLWVVMMLSLVLSGCTSSHNEIEELEKENAVLKKENELVKAKVLGEVTLSIYDIQESYKKDENYKNVVVSFFQSDPFMISMKTTVANQLKVNERYTFVFQDLIIEDMTRREMKKIDHEWLIYRYSDQLQFVQKATDEGLESDQLKLKVIQ
ncbi:MAG: hypothetical protein ACLUVC_12340 [Longibaculum sp.]